MKTALIKVNGGSPRQAIIDLFKAMLEQRIVDALIVPQEVPSRRMVVPTLVVSSDGLASAIPFAPVAIINAARAVSRLTATDPGFKVGAILRPCEIRALVEIAKLRQATLERILIIGVDCLGTFEPTDYYHLTETGLDVEAWLAQAASSGQVALNGTKVRTACAICNAISPVGAHLSLHWVGCNVNEELYLTYDDSAVNLDDLFEAGILWPGELPPARQSLVESLQKQRREVEEQLCADFASRVADINCLLDELASCMGCHNCRKVCPICVCRECIFESNLFEHEPAKYLQWAAASGAIKLPADTLLYHLTRMHHMAVSCVGCGQCESGCPSKIPLTLLFRTIGKTLQDLFTYVPGANVGEPPPLTTYKEHELEPR